MKGASGSPEPFTLCLLRVVRAHGISERLADAGGRAVRCVGTARRNAHRRACDRHRGLIPAPHPRPHGTTGARPRWRVLGMIVAHLGPCVGCNRFGRLYGQRSDACIGCLRRCTDRFIALARRVRRDPAFAAMVYRQLPEAWRKRFEMAFRVPP